MSDPFDEFERRVLALREGRRRFASTSFDDEELSAMVASFLGPNYDTKRVEQLRRERANARRRLAALARHRGSDSATNIARLANREIANSLARARTILGDRDFERLFGTEALEPIHLVDPSAISPTLARSIAPVSIQQTVESLTNDLVAGIVDAIKGASLVDLLAETDAGAKRGLGRSAVMTGSSSAAAKGGRLARRSADDIAAALAQVQGLLKKHKDGLRAEQIRDTLRIQSKEMPRVLSDGLAKRKLRKKGQKRATTYFAV
jgi:hypothetical protein